MPEEYDNDNDFGDSLKFFRGLRNGCVVSIPMWVVILYVVCLSVGCCHGWQWS